VIDHSSPKNRSRAPHLHKTIANAAVRRDSFSTNAIARVQSDRKKRWLIFRRSQKRAI
jgi:hypothetical protein